MDSSVVRIFDTSLRDGEQSPGFSMNTEEKIRMARQLAALGVDVIEAGFPISSRGDLEAVQRVAREVRTVPIAALARAMQKDVNAAIEALEPAAAPPDRSARRVCLRRRHRAADRRSLADRPRSTAGLRQSPGGVGSDAVLPQ